MWGGEGCKECLGGEVKRRDWQILHPMQDGGTSSGGCVHEAFRRKKFYALKVKKGLSALCHTSQAGINTI